MKYPKWQVFTLSSRDADMATVPPYRLRTASGDSRPRPIDRAAAMRSSTAPCPFSRKKRHSAPSGQRPASVSAAAGSSRR